MNELARALPKIPEFASFDPFSAALRDDAFPIVAEAHATRPVFFDRKLGAWILTRYMDVEAALRDSATFSSRGINGLLPTPAELVGQIPDLRSDQFTNIMGLDAPEHGPVRMPMQRALSRRIVDSIEPYARQVANELIDGFIERGECDLVNDFAYPFSGRAIAAVLGLPGDDVAQYRLWFNDFNKLFVSRPVDGPGEISHSHGFTEDHIRELWREVPAANALFRRYVFERQKQPGEDVISMMLAMKDKAGNPAYTVGEIVQSVLTLLGGGQDTTANLIGGITMMFTQNPDQQALLVSDFSLLPKAVAEGVRRKGPALGVVRRTTGAVTMHGVDIPAGAIVYLSIQGANMDPDMFDDPGRFDIRRPNADKHLGFGLGRHACVGQPLARLETEIAIEALYRRLPGLKIDMAQKRTFSPSFGAAILESLRAYW